MTIEEYNIKVSQYLVKLTEAHVAKGSTFEVIKGKRFDKVVENMNNGQKMAHCFIEKSNGDLLKTASWAAPAKGKRGSIFDERPPLKLGHFYRNGHITSS